MNGRGTINFDPDGWAQLEFNPLLCESYKNFSLCKDNDPGVNFYLENCSCKYDTEDSFNNILAENQSLLNLKCSSLETGLSLHNINVVYLINLISLRIF